jgi:group I intron endonuclease
MPNFNKNKKYHFIYKTTNLLNGQYYIGMHSTSNLHDGYLGSGKRLNYSINKYGKKNFKMDILEQLPSRELLIEKEKEIINVEILKDLNCLNLQTGGFSGFDYIKKLRTNNPEYDKKWRALQSSKLKKVHQRGKFKYDTFTNKTHSDETKKLMSIQHRGKGIGEKNSQYNTCWITKNKMNKKIKKSELSCFLENGWIQGRF